jgi:heat shock protein HslJ
MTGLERIGDLTADGAHGRRRRVSAALVALVGGPLVVATVLAGCAATGTVHTGDQPATSGPVKGSGDDAGSGDSAGDGGGTASGAPSAGSGSIDGAAAEWTLVSLADGTGTVTDPLPAPTIDLRSAGAMQGSGGCNTYSASYSGTAAALTISPVLATKRACASGSALESRYFAALEGVTSATVAGSDLTMRGDGVALTFRQDAQQQTTGGDSSGSVVNN